MKSPAGAGAELSPAVLFLRSSGVDALIGGERTELFCGGAMVASGDGVDTEMGVGSVAGGGESLLFTPARAAGLLAVRESWLRRMAGRREVPCTFVGRSSVLGRGPARDRRRRGATRSWSVAPVGAVVTDGCAAEGSSCCVFRSGGEVGSAIDGHSASDGCGDHIPVDICPLWSTHARCARSGAVSC